MIFTKTITSFLLWTALNLANFVAAGDGCKNLKKLDYELFGTKTIYEDARRFLKKVDEDDLPKSFDDDSLEEEHKDLLEDSCKPIVFYFIGRHSARFPDGADIDLYNKKLADLKEGIKFTEPYKRCPSSYKSFINWTSKMQNKHDNLITHLGGEEERNIARRFKRVYPEFFDVSKSEVQIGVTSKLRTAQTGMEFLKEVEGLKIPNCDFNNLPTNDVFRSDYSLDKILQDPCYKSLMDKDAKSFLEFHTECDKIGGKNKTKDPRIERIKNPAVLRKVAENVAEKLGLSERSESMVSSEVLNSIWNMCKFENAMKDDSVWCSLFSKNDIKALEYIEDVKSYIGGAYGENVKVKQTCPLVKNLIEAFEEGIKLTGAPGEKRKAYYFFSHAGPMKKLLAAFGLFKDDDSFSESRIRDFEGNLKVPKDRKWRSSVISPFSANMAFVLYRCEKAGRQVKHKVLATVTERPVKLAGCKDTRCSVDKFFAAYNDMKNCDLNEICSKS